MNTDYKEAFAAFKSQIDALDTSALEGVELGKFAPATLFSVRMRWANAVNRLKAEMASDADDIGRTLAG